ncbi:glycosyltransferase [Sphingosinicella sp. LHD-64]|uniref:glycosyltransferase n=1 Tax=Sphingosinicella sp. LHD-64 TaxID=3072139 RepID=UPI00281006BE|nr:glycosyltransferase [Sphingosinicella sp. LHD-64]MDQ8755961.1 glycosyltransferase [Sphingosinicella sp. LHD-64]
MLRVLTLSTLFPNALKPTLGVFVERQTLGLAARKDVAVEVVAPVGLPIWPLSRHPHYAPLAALPRQESWKGLTVHRPRYRVWPRLGVALTARSIAKALLPLLRDIRARFPFDVIDAEFFWPDGPAAVRLGRALGVPVSIKARGSDIHYWTDRPGVRSRIIAAGRAADGMLAVSEALKRDMVALGMPSDRISVHRTGVDMARFQPVDRGAAKAELGLSGALLVCAGALIERKGQRIVIETLARLPGASLILVGEGPDRPVLERMIRDRGLNDRVRLVGNRPHEELPRYLAAADLALQPSLSEGLANVWVEAMACGTPVVTCDVGGAREAIDRPAAGRLVARDAEAFASAAAQILADPPGQDEVRVAAERFSWEKNSDQLFAHLSALGR